MEVREYLACSQLLTLQRPDAGGAPPYADARLGTLGHGVTPRGVKIPIRDPAALRLFGTPFDNFAVTAVTEKHRIPLVTASAAADSIFNRGFKYVFNTTDVASYMPGAIVSYLKTRQADVKTVAVVYENFLFTSSLHDVLVKELTAAGFKIVLDERYPLAGKDFPGLWTKAKLVNPDAVIVYVGHNEYLDAWIEACTRPFSHRVRRLLERSWLGRRIATWLPARTPAKDFVAAARRKELVSDAPLITEMELERGRRNYEAQLEEIVESIQAMRAVAVLCAPVSDIVDTPPQHSSFAPSKRARSRRASCGARPVSPTRLAIYRTWPLVSAPTLSRHREARSPRKGQSVCLS